MKEEQDKLERQLWEEREDIRKSHEEKVTVAKNKYTTCLTCLSRVDPFSREKMIGVGMSKQEAQVTGIYFTKSSKPCVSAEHCFPLGRSQCPMPSEWS